ncbi:hypothetical protein BA059_17005 [Mycolicibacterium sp. (ex Dasyatis americana)]|nr:hypothetical protein BA059_17005 [Mycolicibacterium sp. (ex Dasyatis americana)]
MAGDRVADRLALAAAGALVGRDVERDQLRAWVSNADGPSVVFVHGPAGIGKTALASVALAGPRTLLLDAREVEPTPVTVVARIGSLLGVAVTRPGLADVADAIAAEGINAVLIDSYERFGVVDGWLRNALLPMLPARTTTVLVGRNPPNVAWRVAPGWRHLKAELKLGPLTEAGAAEFVARHGLPDELAERARLFGRGYPLALELACEALARHPSLVIVDGPPAEVVEELVDVLLDDLDADLRHAVEAASVLRRITIPTLAAVIDRAPADVESMWAALRELPFATVRPDGISLQEVVQEVAARSLELRDPGRARDLRRRAARAALATVGSAPGWSATADLLHLVQNPVVRNAFIPPAGLQHPVESARGADVAEVTAMTKRHIGDAEAALMNVWWQHHPNGLAVARNTSGQVAAFGLVVESACVAPALLAADPVAVAMTADLAARPLRRGGRALLSRRMLTLDGGAQPCPELALMTVDLKRTYLEMRPDLMRVYTVAEPGSAMAAMIQSLGFAPVECGRAAGLWALEMPEGSVDAWIARHIEFETSPPRPVPADSAILSRVAALSAREREVLAALSEGLSNQGLADRLFISERTANRHLSNIFAKLGVRNRTAAARVAIEAGLAN